MTAPALTIALLRRTRGQWTPAPTYDQPRRRMLHGPGSGGVPVFVVAVAPDGEAWRWSARIRVGASTHVVLGEADAEAAARVAAIEAVADVLAPAIEAGAARRRAA